MRYASFALCIGTQTPGLSIAVGYHGRIIFAVFKVAADENITKRQNE